MQKNTLRFLVIFLLSCLWHVSYGQEREQAVHVTRKDSVRKGDVEVFLEREKNVTAANLVQLNGVNGADMRVHLGCDGVFDKPIIILEGFDIGNNTPLEKLTERYYPSFRAYRNNGYDLVLVNYHNGRDWIQSNAEVLKRVVNEVNTSKTGSAKLIVIGESMSGLVGRYALRSMEVQGQLHNVSHFIAFDSPHRGANVPAGMVSLRRWIPDAAFPLSAILDGLANVFNVIPELQALSEPASKQMLLTYLDGPTTGPAPEYVALQNELQAMGNNGYPSQCKNIAMVSGSLSGDRQRNGYGEYLQPDEHLIKFIATTVVVNLWIDVWSSKINESNKVFDGNQIGVGTGLPSIKKREVTQTVNYDRTPGGYINFEVPSMAGTWKTQFSFVPVFSAIDYRGSLNTDADHTFSVYPLINGTNQVLNKAYTPFDAIYGAGYNSYHVSPQAGLWETLGENEQLFANRYMASTCQPIPKPEIPRVRLKESPLTWGDVTVGIVIVPGKQTPLGFPRPYPANELNSQTYQRYIRVTWGQNNVQNLEINEDSDAGIRWWDYGTFPPGPCKLESVVKYAGSNMETVSDPLYTYLASKGYNTAPHEGCNFIDHELAGRLPNEPDWRPVFARFINGVWITVDYKGDFVPRSRLLANGWSVADANCFSETDPRNVTTIAPGCYTIKGKQSGKFLQSPATTAAEVVRQYGASNQANQIWKIEDVGSNTMRILSQSNGQFWDVNGANNNNGSDLIQYGWTGGNNQRFTFTGLGDGSYRITPVHATGKAIDMNGTADGNMARQWDWTGGDNQRWLVSSASCNSTPACFTASASNGNQSVSCSAPVSLAVNCGGDCSGLSYTWSGNGISGSGSSVSFNAPVSSGSYTYSVLVSKAGCSSQPVSFTVNTSCGGSSNTTTCNGRTFTDGQLMGTYLNRQVYVRIIGGCLYATVDSPAGGPVAIDWIYGLNSANGAWAVASMTNPQIQACFKSEGQSCGGSSGCFTVSSNGNPSIACGSQVTLSTSCTGGDCNGVTYSWSGNGVSGNGSSISFAAPASAGTTSGYQVTVSKAGCPSQTVYFSVTTACGGSGTGCSGYNFTDGQYLGTSLGAPIYVRVIGSCLYVTKDSPSGSPVALDWLYILIDQGTWGPNVTQFPSGVVGSCFKQPEQSCGGREPVSFIERPATFVLVPNPAEERVEVRADQPVSRVVVYDLKGRRLLQTDQTILSLSGLAPGSYLVEVRTSTGKVLTGTLVKK